MPCTVPLQAYSSQKAPAHQRDTLVAVRRAAWPFLESLNRSARFSSLLLELSEQDTHLKSISASLVERLHALVPKISCPQLRRRALAMKRAIFNHRPLPGQMPSESTDPLFTLLPQLHEYAHLIRRPEELISESRDAILSELRQGIEECASRTDFRLALAASSPTLLDALRRHERLGTPLSPRDFRSLYAYMCRFSAKVNPLHLFTHIVPGCPLLPDPPHDARSSPRCEVVFDVEALLTLERRILACPIEPRRIRVQLRPLARTPTGWQFWFRRDDALCTAHLPDLPILHYLKNLYERRRTEGQSATFGLQELEQLLSDEQDELARTRAHAAVQTLMSCGVLAPYLIEQLTRPASTLGALSPEYELLISCIGRWHLRLVKPEELNRLDQELSSAVPPEVPPVRYYVNSYTHDDLTEPERAAREISEQLSELKSVLTLESNFSPWRRVFRAFFTSEIPEGESRPYLDLLARFLRRRSELLEQLNWGRNRTEYEAHARRCSAHDGQLDRAQLRSLACCIRPAQPASLCCVGPFDFVTRRFYLTNIFAGEQRFVSRYLLSRPSSAPSHEARNPAIDVELVLPREHTLNFVVPRYETGFGFESRWAHGYRYWLDPTQILIGVENGVPVYLDAQHGKRIRFHYRGLLLASHLPVEYQLLLDQHDDAYLNPFARNAPRNPATEVEHRRELFYGAICLRREAWWTAAPTITALLRAQDPVTSTLRLRRWMRETLAPTDLWFYRLPQCGRRGEKPRLLDLQNPLSVLAFRHALAHAANDVVFTRMEPEPAGLWEIEGKGYVSELMIEV